MNELNFLIKSCTQCPLHKVTPSIAVGSGNSNAKLVFVELHPDYYQASLNDFFVNRYGELFSRILREAGIDKKDIYITYVIKCFSKRDMRREYIDVCKQWLMQELDIIKPKVIIPLGIQPSLLFIAPSKFVSSVGRIMKWNETPLFPWYSLQHLLNGSRLLVNETVRQFSQVYTDICLTK